MSSQILPPKSNPPMPRIPPQSPVPKLELLYQEIGDDEPTLKMLVPPHLLHMSRRPDPYPPLSPNWGLIVVGIACLVFWGSAFYIYWALNG